MMLFLLLWQLVANCVPTSSQETQYPGIGGEKSFWVKTIPPIDSKLKIDKENSIAIRNRMEGKVTNIFAPFISVTSPSFD